MYSLEDITTVQTVQKQITETMQNVLLQPASCELLESCHRKSLMLHHWRSSRTDWANSWAATSWAIKADWIAYSAHEIWWWWWWWKRIKALSFCRTDAIISDINYLAWIRLQRISVGCLLTSIRTVSVYYRQTNERLGNRVRLNKLLCPRVRP